MASGYAKNTIPVKVGAQLGKDKDQEMTYWIIEDLDTIGNMAAIGAFAITSIGAGVGIFGYFSYRCEFRKKRLALEKYLAGELRKAQDSSRFGQKSMLNIIRHVGLTEDEILKISFSSKKIDRKISQDVTDGFADRLLFVYVDKE